MKNDYPELLRKVGDNIRKYRKEKNISQETLAHLSDIDRTYMSYIENAKHNVSLMKLCDIANVLDIDVRELLGREKEQP
ncbi:helix-turn-helix domain-containing protein [Membranihabitans maritimus]|uniref:helix-turn-helix domain-containing protein n=1 Tax=Membranihabitans maritimus TaxID=2904244 RepID=UPI001F30E941|nr:helix-turn-helix transcriptional regulator [Membranihabitans maritimus]